VGRHRALHVDTAPPPGGAGELELRHLQLVLAVADTEDLEAAARRLRLPRATAESRLQRLERDLGPLFDRTAGHLRPTDRGALVVDRARAVVTAMGALERELGDPDGGGRTVRVAAAVLPVETWLPALRDGLPGSSWTVRATGAAAGRAEVAAGRADLFVGLRRVDAERAEPLGAGLVEHAMLLEPSWVRLPTAHPAAARRRVAMADLAGEVWAVLPDRDLEDGLVGACRRAGFEPDVRFHPTEPAMKEQLAATGEAVSLTSPLAGSGPGFVLRPVTDGPVYAWTLVHRAAQEWEVVARAVVPVVRALYREAAATAPGVPDEVRTAGPILA
jgi:DNA-binding transcriptional LysR family regulator